MTKVKICGLKRDEDIDIVNGFKPDFCGFIIDFPKSHRSLSPDRVRSLVNGLDRNNITPVGVFVNADIELPASLLNDRVIEIAQLHGDEDEEYIKDLKRMTGKQVIRAFKVKSRSDLEQAASSCADYVLLDRGQGSGETFDWNILENSAELAGRRWFLAGGLAEDNIAEAISAFRPFGVDLSSSVETDRFKDRKKVKRIIDIIRRMN